MPTIPLPETLPPNAGALLRLIAEMLVPEDLRRVAEADYGQRADEHLAALREIVSGGALDLGQRVPGEVLELARWDQPPIEPSQEQRHWRRAFACTALLGAYGRAENEGHVHGPSQTLIGLIDSLHALERILPTRERWRAMAGIDAAGTALLAWLTPRLSYEPFAEAAFFGLGLLWFALACEVEDPALVALAEWIMAAEDATAAPLRDELGAPLPGDWLLGTTVFNLNHDLWCLLGARLPERLSPRHGPQVVEAVCLISAMIVHPPGD